jgi:hypothetical protein
MKRALALCVALGTLALPSSPSARDLADRVVVGLHQAWIYVDPSGRMLVPPAAERALNERLMSRQGVPIHVVVAGGTGSSKRDGAKADALAYDGANQRSAVRDGEDDESPNAARVLVLLGIGAIGVALFVLVEERPRRHLTARPG